MRSLPGLSRPATTLLLLAFTLGAAEYRGTVSSSGLPIPGATVTATQGQTRRIAVTDESGSYVFPDLAEGSWTIEVEIFGFQKVRREIHFPAESSTNWELTLATPFKEAPAPARQQRQGFERLLINRTAQEEILSQLEKSSLP